MGDAAPSDTAALAARFRAMHAAAWLAADQHDFVRAAQLFEQSRVLRGALGESVCEAQLLLSAARQARVAGQYGRATALFEAAVAEHRSKGDRGSASSGGSWRVPSRVGIGAP